MPDKLGRKLRWFDLGAEAFARQLPNIQSRLGEQRRYVCPLCIKPDGQDTFSGRFFSRETVAMGLLTEEHSPPESFGGQAIVLTCKECNNLAGSTIDAHARRAENPTDALTGRLDDPTRVRVQIGEHSVLADFSGQGNTNSLVVAQDPRAHKPGAVDAFKENFEQHVHSGSDIHLNFYADRFNPHFADASWLRSAYLAAFALAGYTYVFHPGLEIVRKQIREPGTKLIHFIATRPDNPPWSERGLFAVTEPEWLRSLAVTMGRYVVVLPAPNDSGLYDRIRQAKADGVAVPKLSPQFSWDWPIEPTFGLPQPPSQ